jgi:hypothetical protein
LTRNIFVVYVHGIKRAHCSHMDVLRSAVGVFGNN